MPAGHEEHCDDCSMSVNVPAEQVIGKEVFPGQYDPTGQTDSIGDDEIVPSGQ